jgi:hypothetical protein
VFDPYRDDVTLPLGRGLAGALRAREVLRDRRRPEQVFNARRPVDDLTPVSQTPADAVTARWAALLPGQVVPLHGEDEDQWR